MCLQTKVIKEWRIANIFILEKDYEHIKCTLTFLFGKSINETNPGLHIIRKTGMQKNYIDLLLNII